MTENLKTCPICGGEASVEQNGGGEYFVLCKNQCISTGSYETREEAECEWNERGDEGAKPARCPFCGGETDVWVASNSRCYIRCDNCGASQRKTYMTQAIAIRAWNRMNERNRKD